MNDYLVLTRRGEFVSECPSYQKDWCGSSKHSRFEYKIQIIFHASFVGRDGIILYHEDIDEHIKKNLPKGTCEQMTESLINSMKDLCKNNKIYPIVICTEVRPIFGNKKQLKAFLRRIYHVTDSRSLALLPLLSSSDF